MSTEFLIPKFMDEPLFVHDSASEIDIIRKIHLFLQKGKNPSSRWRSKAKLKYCILPAMCLSAVCVLSSALSINKFFL